MTEVLLCVVVGFLLEAISIAWAYFEIQIEGPNSWASGLPYTWKKNVSWFSKPITGYHVSLGILGMLVIMLPLAVISLVVDLGSVIDCLKNMGGIDLVSVSGNIILAFLSLLLVIVLHEDFLWNAINPDPRFGVKDFKSKYPQIGEKSYIPHTPIPTFFAGLTVASFIFAFLAGITAEWMVIFITMLVVTLVIARARYKLDMEQEE